MTSFGKDAPGRSSDGPAQEPAFQFTDKRRVDPSGSVRDIPHPGSAAADPGDLANASQPIAVEVAPSEELAAAQQEAAERTADLQRLSAEYANYRKRVDRDRELVTASAKSAVLTEMLTVLDDLDRAEAHGDLTGAFKAVADKLQGILGRFGLVRIGAEGDLFDPAVHEAVQFSTSSEVSEPTVSSVLRHGYSVGDRVVRAAVVVVTGPDHETAEPADTDAAVVENVDAAPVSGDEPDESGLDTAGHS